MKNINFCNCFFITIFILIFSSCTKYVDLVFKGSVSGDDIIIARFPVGVNDKDAQSAILDCKYAAWIHDSDCNRSELKTECIRAETSSKTTSSFCLYDNVKIPTF